MAQITIQFSAQNDIGSDVIKIFEHGLYSHVDVVMPDGSLLGARSDKILGIPAGVYIRPNTYANFSAAKRITIECADEEKSKFYEFANDQIGKPYDETAILAFAANRDWRNPDSWFCSEMGAAALEASGILLHPLATTVNKITPEDLLLVCSVLTEVG